KGGVRMLPPECEIGVNKVVPPNDLQDGACCKILVLYRQVHRREASPSSRVFFRRGTCDRGIWRKPLAFAGDAALPMGFQSIFARKALPEAGFAKKAVIDAYPSFHEGKHLSFAKARFRNCLQERRLKRSSQLLIGALLPIIHRNTPTLCTYCG